MKLYMKVTADEYEFPLVIADSQADLARMCGVNPQSVRKAFYNARHGRRIESAYREVEIDDE